MHCGATLSVLFALHAFSLAAQTAYYNDTKYNQGAYGKYVSQKFKSNPDFVAPVVNFMRPFTACDDGSYIFITPRGHIVIPRAMILDVNGDVLWSTTRDYGKIYDLRVQQYRGKPHLTFWAGTDVVDGHGIGYHYVLDEKYEEVLRFTGAQNAGSDLHVFTITPQNSARYIYYNRTVADTSSISKWFKQLYVWDSVFQEADLETEKVLFRWSALDHLNITDSTVEFTAASPGSPWDPFHMNDVVKDSRGNYLTSFRYTNAIVYIDGRTGDVLWQLGGKHNSFRDLSDGEATTFAGQHDVQWISEGRIISLFDNRADWYHQIGDHSRGVRIKIDTEKMTAEVDRVFENPQKILSASQGSYQTLKNGNVLLGYGFNGVFTEFSPTGEVLCDAYFQPASTFGSGNVQSYHAMKFKWKGYPSTDPDLVFEKKSGKFFVSWNGATEVQSWLFQGTDQVTEDGSQSGKVAVASQFIDTIPKSGFETEFSLSGRGDLPRFVRVAGLDRKSKVLGHSKFVDLGSFAEEKGRESSGAGLQTDGEVWGVDLTQPGLGTYVLAQLGSILAICTILYIVVRCLRRLARRRRF